MTKNANWIQIWADKAFPLIDAALAAPDTQTAIAALDDLAQASPAAIEKRAFLRAEALLRLGQGLAARWTPKLAATVDDPDAFVAAIEGEIPFLRAVNEFVHEELALFFCEEIRKSLAAAGLGYTAAEQLQENAKKASKLSEEQKTARKMTLAKIYKTLASRPGDEGWCLPAWQRLAISMPASELRKGIDGLICVNSGQAIVPMAFETWTTALEDADRPGLAMDSWAKTGTGAEFLSSSVKEALFSAAGRDGAFQSKLAQRVNAGSEPMALPPFAGPAGDENRIYAPKGWLKEAWELLGTGSVSWGRKAQSTSRVHNQKNRKKIAKASGEAEQKAVVLVTVLSSRGQEWAEKMAKEEPLAMARVSRWAAEGFGLDLSQQRPSGLDALSRAQSVIEAAMLRQEVRANPPKAAQGTREMARPSGSTKNGASAAAISRKAHPSRL